MLNQLYHLAECLEAEGLLVAPRHVIQRTISGQQVLWLGIEEGGIVEAEICQNSGKLYKIQPSNQRSWPAVNGRIPLFATPVIKEGRNEGAAKVASGEMLVFLEAQKSDIIEGCQKIYDDILSRAKWAGSFLPQNSNLAESAKNVSRILGAAKQREVLGEKIYDAIILAVRNSEDDFSLVKRFVTATFLLPKSKAPGNLPIVVGMKQEYGGLLRGGLVTDAVSKMESVSALSAGLFGPTKNRPYFSGYPLMQSGIFTSSRTPDFPALHGYFGGGFASVSDAGMEKMRAALDYLTSDDSLHRRLSLGKTDFLILACPLSADPHGCSAMILQAMRTKKARASKKVNPANQIQFEAAAQKILSGTADKKTPLEVALLLLRSPMKANIQVVLSDSRRFEDWVHVVNEFKGDQVLPGSWTTVPATFTEDALGILEIDEGLKFEFLIAKGFLRADIYAANQGSKVAMLTGFLRPKEVVPLNLLFGLQRTLLSQLKGYTLATLSSQQTLFPGHKESPAVIPLAKALGLLIMTTTRINARMTDTPLTEQPAFLLGQCLHYINKMESCVRALKAKSRGQKSEPPSGNLKGSRLAAQVEIRSPAEGLILITSEAAHYQTVAQKEAFRFKQNVAEKGVEAAKAGGSSVAASLITAGKDLSRTLDEISQHSSWFFNGHRTPTERQQFVALVRLGLNARHIAHGALVTDEGNDSPPEKQTKKIKPKTSKPTV